MDEPVYLSPEALNALPIRRYEGEVLVVETEAELARAAAELREETLLGFDTETRPAFRPGERYLPALAQVAGARAVYLLRPQRPAHAALLAEIVAAPGIVKAGVALADDLRKLKELVPFDEAAVVDVGRVAKRHGVRQTGLRTLAGLFLGFRIPKGTSTSNWAAARLTPQQVRYAATDAWASRELYRVFSERWGALETA